MKVSIITVNDNFYIFGDATEVSKIEGAIRVRHGEIVQCFAPEEILELKVDERNISL